MLIHSAVITGSVQLNNTDVSSITNVAGFATTSSVDSLVVKTGSYATTSSVNNLQSVTGSYATTSSFGAYTSSNDTTNTTQNTRLSTIESVTGSYATTSSVNNLQSVTGSYATTGSNQFNGNQSISGSITSNGTITAQTLVVQTVTSSIEFVTGSTRNGSLSSNTHQFTGSVLMTGSLSVVTTGTEFQVNAGGVNIGNALTDSHIISGSVLMTGSLTVGGAAAFSRNINGTGEGTFMGLDAQAVPRLGFVKISGAQPFLGFGADTFTIRVSNGSTIATSSVFTTALAITTAGVLELPYGQLKFPSSQNASADANTLDDYEEGTFTATVVGGTTAGTGTYSRQVGVYTKIGNLVTCNVWIQWSAHTGTGDMFFGGFPFTSIGTTNYRASGFFGYVENLTLSAGYIPAIVITPSTTQASVTQIPVGGGAAGPAVPMDSAANLHFAITYQTT